MSTKLTTKAFRVHAAQQLLESISEPAKSIYYVFASRQQPWGEDAAPPSVDDSNYDVVFDVNDKMLFGKLITNDDVRKMIPRYNWTSNTIYPMYDDRDPDLGIKPFFVTVDANTEFHVFKCLNNNHGVKSTFSPTREDTSEADEYYSTADGYQWKYLYSVPSASMKKFATSSWIPLEENANTVANAVSGALDVIIVESPGVRYNAYAAGYFQNIGADANGDLSFSTIESTSSSNTDFFKNSAIKVVNGPGAGQQRIITNYTVTGGQKVVYLDSPWDPLDPPDTSSRYEISPNVVIIGDGAGAIARGIVNGQSNTIHSIEITARGNNYTYAQATVVSNTGQISVSNNSAIQANNAVLRVIIGPPGGHGSDLSNELGATAIGFATTFANNENHTIPDSGSFRQIGLIKDPLFANVQLALTDVSGVFALGESISISNSNITGVVTSYNANTAQLTLTNVFGSIVSNTIIVGSTSNTNANVSSVFINGTNKPFDTFDQRTRFGVTMNGTDAFTAGQYVEQPATEANAFVQFANTTFVAVNEVRGVFDLTGPDQTFHLSTSNASANINAIVSPDLIKNSGQVIYIENMQPIGRGPALSEEIKFIIKF